MLPLNSSDYYAVHRPVLLVVIGCRLVWSGLVLPSNSVVRSGLDAVILVGSYQGSRTNDDSDDKVLKANETGR